MTRYEALLRRLASHSGLAGPVQDELVADAVEVASHRRFGRVGELSGLVAFVVRRRAAMATDDRPVRYVRQGLWSGGTVLLVLGLACLVREAIAHRPGPSGFTMAVAIAALAVLGAGARRRVITVAAVVTLVLVAVGLSEAGAIPVVRGLPALLIVVVLCLAAGDRPATSAGAHRGTTVGMITVAVMAAVAPLGLVGPLVFGGLFVVPFALLALGRLDARLAVAAATLWLYRFVALDVDGWVAAGRLITGSPDQVQAGRLVFMQGLFIVSVALSRRAVRDAERLSTA